MATQYHVYQNDGAGGPVDYGTVVATTASLSYLTATLTYPGDYLFAVRAYDTVSSLEESNVDAVVRIILDAAGVDITSQPNAPTRYIARATAGGGASIEWDYQSAGQRGAPTGFKVWVTSGGTVNYAVSPTTTVAYSVNKPHYRATTTGLVNGTSYAIGIRAYNATATEANTTSIDVVGDTTGPDAVDGFAVAASY